MNSTMQVHLCRSRGWGRLVLSSRTRANHPRARDQMDHFPGATCGRLSPLQGRRTPRYQARKCSVLHEFPHAPPHCPRRLWVCGSHKSRETDLPRRYRCLPCTVSSCLVLLSDLLSNIYPVRRNSLLSRMALLSTSGRLASSHSSCSVETSRSRNSARHAPSQILKTPFCLSISGAPGSTMAQSRKMDSTLFSPV